MSEQNKKGFYVFQPDPPRADGRMYSIGGLPLDVICRRLTKAEAQACVDALTKLAASEVSK